MAILIDRLASQPGGQTGWYARSALPTTGNEAFWAANAFLDILRSTRCYADMPSLPLTSSRNFRPSEKLFTRFIISPRGWPTNLDRFPPFFHLISRYLLSVILVGYARLSIDFPFSLSLGREGSNRVISPRFGNRLFVGIDRSG